MPENDILLSVGPDPAGLKNFRNSIQQQLTNIKASIDERGLNIREAIEKQTKGIKIDLNAEALRRVKKIVGEIGNIKIAFDEASASKFRNKIQSHFDKNPIIVKVAASGTGVRAGAVGNIPGQLKSSLQSSDDVTASISRRGNLKVKTNDVEKLTYALGQLSSKYGTASKSAAENAQTTEQAARAINNFGERVGFTAGRLTAYLIPATLFFQSFRALSFATQSVTDINAEIVRLTQILDGNANKAGEVAEQVLKIGTAYGQSGKDILKTTVLLAQSGKEFSNIEDLVNVTNALAKTNLAATFGSVEETTQGLIAVLGQFNLTASDTNKILDVSNELAKRFASESKDIFEAVQRGGAAFAVAGGNFEDFAATVSTLRQLTRLPASQVGTGLNTIALRSLRPDVIEFTSRLTDGKIFDAQGHLKGITDRLVEVGKALKGASKEQFGFAAEIISGIRQGKELIPLLKDIAKGNDSVFKSAREAAKGSFGSLSRDAALGLDRIDVQLKSIGSRFQEVFGKLAGDKSIQRLIKDFATLAKGLADVLDLVRPILPILLKLGAIKLGLGLVGSASNVIKGFRRAETGTLTPGGVADLTTFNSSFGVTRGLSKGTLSQEAQAQNLANVLSSMHGEKPSASIAKAIKKAAPVVPPVVSSVNLKPTDALGIRSRLDVRNTLAGSNFDVGRISKGSAGIKRSQEFAALTDEFIGPKLPATQAKKPAFSEAQRADFISKRTAELLKTKSVPIDTLSETRSRLAAERTQQLISRTQSPLGLGNKISPEQLLRVASPETLKKVEDAEKKGFSTNRALQRFASPEERLKAATTQGLQDVAKLTTSQLAKQTIPADVTQAIAKGFATKADVALRQATEEFSKQTSLTEPLKLKRQGQSTSVRSAFGQTIPVPALRQILPRFADEPRPGSLGFASARESLFGTRPPRDRALNSSAAILNGERFVPKTFGAPIPFGRQEDQLLARSNVGRLSQSNVSDFFERRRANTIAGLDPNNLIGRPQFGKIGPVNPQRVIERQEAASRSFQRGGLETGLLDIQKEKAALKTGINGLVRAISSETNSLRSQGQNTDQINAELKEYKTLLDVNQTALKRLISEEQNLANSLRQQSNAGLEAANAARATSLSAKFKGATTRFGQDALSVGKQAVPLIALTAAVTALEGAANSLEAGVKPLIDSKGQTIENFDAVRAKNREASIDAGTVRGTSTALTVGGIGVASLIQAGLVSIPGGIIIAAAIAAAGAIMGRGKAKIEADKQVIQDGLSAAALTKDSKSLGGGLNRSFSDILKQENEKGRTADSGALGGKVFDKLFGKDPFKGVTDTIGRVSSSLDTSLQGQGGQALLENVREQIFETLKTIGPIERSAGQQTITGRVRDKFTENVAKGIEEEAKARGENLSQFEIQTRAILFVTKAFDQLEGKSDKLSAALTDLNTQAVEQANKVNALRQALQQASNNIVQFSDTFNQKTKDIGGRTSNLGANNAVQEQINKALSGKADLFQIPEQFAQGRVQNIQSGIAGLASIPGTQTDRQKVSNLIQKNTGGLISQDEKQVFTDVGLIQDFLRKGLTPALRGLSGKTFSAEQGPELGAEVKTFLEKTFSAVGTPDLQTSEGKGLITEILDTVSKRAGQQPESFKSSPEAFIQSTLGEFADGKILLERFNAVIGQVNTSTREYAILYDRLRQPIERQIQIETERTNLLTNRIRTESSVLGKSSQETVGGLNTLLSQNQLPDLDSFALAVTNAQLNVSKFTDAQGNLLDNSSEAQDAFKVLVTAQDAYSFALAKSANTLNILKAKFEETTKVLGDIVNANKTVGSSTKLERLQAGVSSQRLRGTLGTDFDTLNKIGNTQNIGGALQSGIISEKDLESLRNRLNKLIDLPFIQGDLNNLQKFGGSKLPGSNQTGNEFADLFRTIGGAENPFDSSNTIKDLINASNDQLSTYQQIKAIEDKQLNLQESINNNVMEIAKRIGVDPKSLFSLPKTQQQQNNAPANSVPNVPVVPAKSNAADNSANRDRLSQNIGLGEGLIEAINKSSADNKNQIINGLEKVVQSFREARTQQLTTGNSNVNVEGNFNFSGFESVGKDVVVKGAVGKILEAFIKQLRTGSTQEQELASKLSIALKTIQDQR